MRRPHPTSWLPLALVCALAGCGGSDVWRAKAADVCRDTGRRALAEARAGGDAALARAGTTLEARGRRLAALDGPADLRTLARESATAGRALRAGELAAARTAGARAERTARRLDLEGCAG